ncbi:hypothetical protein QR680_017597 [Steinernema hermaphroditum]|uniref:Receptor expression-enhancing protein n=1 Tax=Steinernema hermaphroditum TaxID=289476 RepID=A0AA39LPE8_9BILA|nr:hypothetical protein QR680_017597 [Steinernema hermaphroditum]
MRLRIFVLICFEVLFAVSTHPTPTSVHELRNWRPDRMVDCIFCLDYDDYNGFAISGCSVQKPMTCRGNACYMRQHKKANYFLYTTGCVNLTSAELESINRRTEEEKPVAKKRGRETQLCEVLKNHLTCICANRRLCNNISNADPFSEYSSDIFDNRDFNETRHFRHFLPHDPLLRYVNDIVPVPYQNVYMMRTSILSSLASCTTPSFLLLALLRWYDDCVPLNCTETEAISALRRTFSSRGTWPSVSSRPETDREVTLRVEQRAERSIAMESADSKNTHNGVTPGSVLDEKAKAVGNLKTNFKKLRALFADAKVRNDGNAVIQLDRAGPATITDVVLPEERTTMDDSFGEVSVEPSSAVATITTTRREEEARTGKRRIMRHWFDATPKNLDKFVSNFLNDPDNALLDSFWTCAEGITMLKRERLFYGLCVAALFYIIVGNFGRLACNLVGFIYPLHASHRALKSKSREQYSDWLKYWCVYSSFAVLDTFVDYYMHPYSGYWLLKCAFVGYLLAPFTQGTNYIFYNYVEPVEATIDVCVDRHNKWEKDTSLLDGTSTPTHTDEGSAEPLSAQFATAVFTIN